VVIKNIIYINYNKRDNLKVNNRIKVLKKEGKEGRLMI